MPPESGSGTEDNGSEVFGALPVVCIAGDVTSIDWPEYVVS